MPVDPTSPKYEPPRDDNHNTPEPPPPSGKGAGLRLQPIKACEPRCPTYGVAVAVLGENRGGQGGAIPWEARTCGVSGGGESERRGLCTLAASKSSYPVSLLPRAWPGSTSLTKEDPSKVSEFPRVKGTITNNNNST